MAKDDEKTTVTPAETPAKPPAKSKKKLFLFGGIGLGVVVIGVVVALFVLRPMMSSGGGDARASGGKETAEAKKEDGKKPEAEKKKPEKKEEKKSEEGKEGGAGNVYSIEDIVVNPAGTGGSRFLSVSFGFAVESPELAKQMEEHEAQVRDVLITILSSKTVADLTDPKQKEVMRLQIKKRLSQVLETEELAGVYYTDFVLQ